MLHGQEQTGGTGCPEHRSVSNPKAQVSAVTIHQHRGGSFTDSVGLRGAQGSAFPASAQLVLLPLLLAWGWRVE